MQKTLSFFAVLLLKEKQIKKLFVSSTCFARFFFFLENEEKTSEKRCREMFSYQ